MLMRLAHSALLLRVSASCPTRRFPVTTIANQRRPAGEGTKLGATYCVRVCLSVRRRSPRRTSPFGICTRQFFGRASYRSPARPRARTPLTQRSFSELDASSCPGQVP
ncbi:hypothetical protein C8Q76DRAFT_492283 [Earliella scabrosa]|nr:hypothetical protein C8Q76DRAFT_492283 [Earliella scabrosa]